MVLSHPAFFEFDGNYFSLSSRRTRQGTFLVFATEANGVILAAQQGDVQSFQFWVFLHYTSKLRKCCCYRRNKQNHTKFKLVFAVHGEEFEGKWHLPLGAREAFLNFGQKLGISNAQRRRKSRKTCYWTKDFARTCCAVQTNKCKVLFRVGVRRRRRATRGNEPLDCHTRLENGKARGTCVCPGGNRDSD